MPLQTLNNKVVLQSKKRILFIIVLISFMALFIKILSFNLPCASKKIRDQVSVAFVVLSLSFTIAVYRLRAVKFPRFL